METGQERSPKKYTIWSIKSVKLYFAGNTGHGKVGLNRERLLKQTGCARLFSLYWMEDFYKNFEIWSENIPKKTIDNKSRVCNITNKKRKLEEGELND